MRTVPVTPAVVAWAVDQSGFTLAEIAEAAGATVVAVGGWLRGASQPSVGQARKLAKKLRRPLAVLLWASPPADAEPDVAFRAPVAEEMRDLSAVERRYIRQAARLQKVASWLRREIAVDLPVLPEARLEQDPAEVAARVRTFLGVPVEDQLGWASEYVALRAWRAQLEERGMLVLALPLGADSCRGITLADRTAPVIVVNTQWNARARIFTLFHELGHVLTGTTSACATSWAHSARGEHVERWCEAFAAAVLMPWASVEQHLARKRVVGVVDDLAIASALARAFKVSLQAAVIRLIHGGRAKWSLWAQIPRDANVKPDGGAPPEEPRTTPVVRLGEIGHAATALLVRGMRADLMDRSQVSSLLRVDEDDLDEIERRVVGAEAGTQG